MPVKPRAVTGIASQSMGGREMGLDVNLKKASHVFILFSATAKPFFKGFITIF
jgi:hypothetical protein